MKKDILLGGGRGAERVEKAECVRAEEKERTARDERSVRARKKAVALPVKENAAFLGKNQK